MSKTIRIGGRSCLSCLVTLILVSNCFFSAQAFGAERFNNLKDAAVEQTQIWQNGGKAKPIMSSDGKIIFAFGQSMAKLTCSPTRACDVEMEAGEKTKKVVLGDHINWEWTGAESIEHGQTIQHIVFQPRDTDLESNVIIMTDRRTYHMKLYAPRKEGVYLNRVGFYYPQDLASDWANSETKEMSVKAKDEGMNILPTAVSIDKLDFGYRIEGKADFQPIRVFNDGERTYMEMPDSLNTGENPVLFLRDEKDEVMMVNYHRNEDPETRKVHYVVDKLFEKAELRMGSQSVQIIWKKKEKNFFQKHGLGRDS